jgi:hypothetical protein
MRQHEATKKKIEGCSRQVNGFHMFPGIFFFAALPPPNCLLATHAGHLANCSQEKKQVLLFQDWPRAHPNDKKYNSIR